MKRVCRQINLYVKTILTVNSLTKSETIKDETFTIDLFGL